MKELSLEFNKVEENQNRIISNKDKKLNKNDSFLKMLDEKYAFLKINIYKISSSINGFCSFESPPLLFTSSVFLFINLNISKTF